MPDGIVMRRHVLRIAAISTVTILGLNIGYLIGGSVVIESVFTLPGLGSLMVNSIFRARLSGHPGDHAGLCPPGHPGQPGNGPGVLRARSPGVL